MPMQKPEEIGSFSKSGYVRLNRLYFRAELRTISFKTRVKRVVYQKKVEKNLQTKTSYTKFGSPIRRSRRLQTFLNKSMKSGVWTLLL